MLSCTIAILQYANVIFMTKSQAWGYGRSAWTAGAFGSLTNGQALPPTLYDIDPRTTIQSMILRVMLWSSYVKIPPPPTPKDAS